MNNLSNASKPWKPGNRMGPLTILFTLSFGFANAQFPLVTYAHIAHTTDLKKGLKAETLRDENGKKFNTRMIKFSPYTNSVEYDTLKRLSLVAQALTIPFKLRSTGSSKLETGFSLGSALGLHCLTNTYSKSSNAVWLLFYAGVSTFTVDSTNSKNAAGASRTGATLAAIVTYEFTNFYDLQVGFTAGRDYNSKNNIDKWIYNNKTWFSLQVGISLFKVDSK
jgi:hypothetical protein